MILTISIILNVVLVVAVIYWRVEGKFWKRAYRKMSDAQMEAKLEYQGIIDQFYKEREEL